MEDKQRLWNKDYIYETIQNDHIRALVLSWVTTFFPSFKENKSNMTIHALHSPWGLNNPIYFISLNMNKTLWQLLQSRYPLYKPSSTTETLELVLKVCGMQWNYYKTATESATLEFLYRDVPSMKVPFLFEWNGTKDNSLHFEYMLMERVPGVVCSSIYEKLSDNQKMSVMNQLCEMIHPLLNLQCHCYHYQTKESIKTGLRGGLLKAALNQDGIVDMMVGPDPDYNIEPTMHRFDTWHAMMDKAIKQEHHGFSNDLLHKIKSFQTWLSNNTQHELNRKHYHLCISHKDIVPKNVMIDPDTLCITAIIDFEFGSMSSIEYELNELFGEEWAPTPSLKKKVIALWEDLPNRKYPIIQSPVFFSSHLIYFAEKCMQYTLIDVAPWIDDQEKARKEQTKELHHIFDTQIKTLMEQQTYPKDTYRSS